MQFEDVRLRNSADALRVAPKAADRACGDNFRFEERISNDRRQAYEAVIGAQGGDLDRGHTAYLRTHVKLADRTAIPDSFHRTNTAATLPALPDQDFVRIENIGWFAEQWYRTEAGLPQIPALLGRRNAASAGERALLDKFVLFWNQNRGGWPMFAASLDEVRAAADADDWAIRLRAQLGLGHLAPEPGKPLLLVQLRYAAADVRLHAQPGQHAMFAAPTVLDGEMNPYFYPAPLPPPGRASSCGRTVHLDNTGPLVAELLTSRIDYRLEHIHSVTLLAQPLPPSAQPARIAPLRNGHLGRLRAALGCHDFAEPMR
jgi:hypothetical protein